MSQDLGKFDGSAYIADSEEQIANSKQGLLNTIRVPANLSNLKMKLPKANYNTSTVNESMKARELAQQLQQIPDGGRSSPSSSKKYPPA